MAIFCVCSETLRTEDKVQVMLVYICPPSSSLTPCMDGCILYYNVWALNNDSKCRYIATYWVAHVNTDIFINTITIA